MIKRSLRNKILISSVTALLLLAVILGITSVCMVGILSNRDSKKIMREFCEAETLKIDNKLNLVQHSVEIIYKFIMDHQDSDLTRIKSKAFEKKIKEFTISVANQTEGAMAVYFRYDPEFSGSGTDGFFWSRNIEDNLFVEEPPTDILAYPSTDIEHVGWFYAPKESGPLWMNPYYNKNLDVFMISYIIPIYMDNIFIGVVGMDIDFKIIVDDTNDNKIYDHGHIAIADFNSRLAYSAIRHDGIQTDMLSDNLYQHMSRIKKTDEPIRIKNDDGKNFMFCCRKLNNNMILYVQIPENEIQEARNGLMFFILMITLIVFTLALIAILERIKHIVKPLEQLTIVANQYAEGNWKAHYISHTEDEIQKLSETMAEMAGNTQRYIDKINDAASKDPLTELRNKNAYNDFLLEMKANPDGRYDEYAVVVMDLNLLKKINDNYGHALGDFLIREAGKFICSIFQHSPIFRIGGDEFVTVLYTEDYENRNILLKKFSESMGYLIPGTTDIHLSIAFGSSLVPSECSDFDSAFKLADERMYANKKASKMERKD